MNHYIIYKPYGMLSQFTREVPAHVTLADLGYTFPQDVYPVGRLDADSEGLLFLTNDKKLNQELLAPENRHPRTYWVQVEGEPTEEALDHLRNGVEIRISGKAITTSPAEARRMEKAPELPERIPPIRVRKHIPDTWLELTLYEGKNRQVRRMAAAVGFPVLRLVRARIGALGLGTWGLGSMEPGTVRELDDTALKLLLAQ